MVVDFEKRCLARDRSSSSLKNVPSAKRRGRKATVVSVVDEDIITEVLSMSTGIPPFNSRRRSRSSCVEDELHKRVIGQNEAVTAFRRRSAVPARV